MDRNAVLLFGDVTGDYTASLQTLAARKDSPILTDFFARTAFALRAEIGKLPLADRESSGFVKFTGFVELLARLRKAKSRHHALDKALTCVHQFASFIRCAEYKLLVVSMLTLSAIMDNRTGHTQMQPILTLSVFAPACLLAPP